MNVARVSSYMADCATEKAQADVVSKYWAERGYEVNVWIETVTAKGNTFKCVRTDMVNGFPKDFKQGHKS